MIKAINLKDLTFSQIQNICKYSYCNSVMGLPVCPFSYGGSCMFKIPPEYLNEFSLVYLEVEKEAAE